MRDQTLKLRELNASHTLGCVGRIYNLIEEALVCGSFQDLPWLQWVLKYLSWVQGTFMMSWVWVQRFVVLKLNSRTGTYRKPSINPHSPAPMPSLPLRLPCLLSLSGSHAFSPSPAPMHFPTCLWIMLFTAWIQGLWFESNITAQRAQQETNPRAMLFLNWICLRNMQVPSLVPMLHLLERFSF
jgi:hypothetical protein